MEAKQQTQANRLMIDADYFDLEGGPYPCCPFCDNGMLEGLDEFICDNPHCPYTNSEVVRDIVAALVEQGRDLLSAAQCAATYAVADSNDPVTAERFAVTDESSANWVLKKLAHLENRRNAAQVMIDQEIESITKRGREITDPLEKNIEFFRSAFGVQLQNWAAEQVAGQRARSVKLLHGTVGFRKQPDRVNVLDEARAIEIAEALGIPDLVRVRKELSKSAAKAALGTPEGAALAGVVELQPGSDAFYITPELPGVL